MIKRNCFVILAMALLLNACGDSELKAYDKSKDPIVKGYKIGEVGTFEVTRIQCLYAEATNAGGPAAVYLTYIWASANSSATECLEEFSGLPLKSADVISLGFTDSRPENIHFSLVGLYSDEVASALNNQAYVQELNSLPPECAVEFNNLPLKDCTVKISVPAP